MSMLHWNFLLNYLMRNQLALHWILSISFSKTLIINFYSVLCRSQLPCGLRRGYWPVGCCDHGFESRSRYECLSSSFCVVLSCVGRGLATGWSLVQGVLPYVNRSRNLLYVRRPTSFKDCRATGKKSCSIICVNDKMTYTCIWVSALSSKILRAFYVYYDAFFKVKALSEWKSD
jgi:hypothetical protein